jgi:hypothetical protein
MIRDSTGVRTGCKSYDPAVDVKKRLGVAFAASPGLVPRQRLSIAAFEILGAQCSRPASTRQPASDPGIALLELLAYVGDALSFYQDQVANEAYLETEDRVRVRLDGSRRPALCVIADDRRAYLVTVSAETGESTVRFGDGVAGELPPSGLDNVIATYRRGDGDTGNLELTGLGLQKPFVVIVVGNPRVSARHFLCGRTLT